MSQVMESAYSCQSCQQDLYKSERGSHHVKVGLDNPCTFCRPSFCGLCSLLSLSVPPNTSAVISRLLLHCTFLHRSIQSSTTRQRQHTSRKYGRSWTVSFAPLFGFISRNPYIIRSKRVRQLRNYGRRLVLGLMAFFSSNKLRQCCIIRLSAIG
jgi:hypothetical protein